MSKHMGTYSGTYASLLAAFIAVVTIFLSRTDRQEDSKGKEQSLKPELQAGIDLSNQTYFVKNIGKGPARIVKIIFYSSSVCLNSDRISGNDFLAAYIVLARKSLKGLFEQTVPPNIIGNNIRIDMAQFPLVGQILAPGQILTLFQAVSQKEIPTEDLNRALTVMGYYYRYKIVYSSESGLTSDQVGFEMADDCT